ncbi:MAG TPA: IS1595 family transposase [Acidobacteriaceae bacterium]|jgi:transposase-like protein|nr:IS1595 family transposase [Acidobacteriaceae bacterium]
MSKPKTLQQAIIHFSDEDNCLEFMRFHRWPDGVATCPTCGRKDVSWLEKQKKWQCKSAHAKRQFSAKVGTIFEDSPLGLDKWLPAVWLITNSKNGVSSCEIARSLGITQKSAWFMLHRIRHAMKEAVGGFIGKLGNSGGGSGVEVDESFVGGKLANMHKGRAKKMQDTRAEVDPDEYFQRYANKTVVMGMFDRESRTVRAKVIPNVKRETLQREILKNIKYGSRVYTDSAVTYNRTGWHYIHEAVNHAETYVRGQVHTNSLENFWSLTKRNLAGTYVAVEPFHLDRYLDEQMFRFNNRLNKSDADRFSKALSQVVNRRLTYAEVTGKVGETAF